MDRTLKEIYQAALQGEETGGPDAEKLDAYLSRLQNNLQENGFECMVQRQADHATMRVAGPDNRVARFVADVKYGGKSGNDIKITNVDAYFWQRNRSFSFCIRDRDLDNKSSYWFKEAGEFIVRSLAKAPENTPLRLAH